MKAIEWLGNRVRILDQTRLPQAEVYLELSHYQDIASAIVELKIRGAPDIGIATAYAVCYETLDSAAKRYNPGASRSSFHHFLIESLKNSLTHPLLLYKIKFE